MLASLPESAKIRVEPSLARDLLKAAQHLPRYDNIEFYSPELQTMIYEALCEDAAELDSLTNQIQKRLSQWPYCVLVQGLTFDEGNKVFVGLNRAFGELVARPYEKPRAQLVHYIQPSTDVASARGGRESERLHTDCADWKTPVELISMVCVNADDAGGGRSRILDLDTIRTKVKQRLGAEALELLA